MPFNLQESMNINPVSPGYEPNKLEHSGYYKPVKKIYES